MNQVYKIKGTQRFKNPAGTYGKKALSGVAWMLTSSFGLNALTLIVTMVLARFLTPSDFGAVVLVTGITGILQTFAEMGTSVAIVQRKNVEPRMIDSAFISTLATTCVVVLILWLISNGIASFFSIPVISPLLKISSIAYFLRGIFALYRCLLLREMRYKEISIIDFTCYIIYGLAATALAATGYGPFSVVWAQCIWSLSLILLGLWRTRYIPRSWGSAAAAWDLMAFGMWVSLGRVLRNSAGQIDNFVVGKVLTAALLGNYHMAQKIVMVIPLAFTRVIDQVMLPIYSKWQDDLPRVEEGYGKAIFYSSLLLVPLIFLIFVFAKPIVLIVFGEKWIGIVPLLRIMSIFGLARVLGDGVFDSVTYALGRPSIVTLMNTFQIIALPSCVILGSFWGIEGVAWGFAGYGVMGRVFGQILLKSVFRFSLMKYLKQIALALIAAIVATMLSTALTAVLSAHSALLENVTNLIALLTWILAYVCIVLAFAREKCIYILRLFCKTNSVTGESVA